MKAGVYGKATSLRQETHGSRRCPPGSMALAFSPPMQAVWALGTQLLRGHHHGYWEEEAIWVEIKVSMTPWLDGSRWLCPLVESELWYNTRLLEDTVGLVLSR